MEKVWEMPILPLSPLSLSLVLSLTRDGWSPPVRSSSDLKPAPDLLGDERSPMPARLPPHQMRQDYDGEARAALPGPSRPSSPPSEADRGRSGPYGSRAPTPSPSPAACSGPPGGRRAQEQAPWQPRSHFVEYRLALDADGSVIDEVGNAARCFASS